MKRIIKLPKKISIKKVKSFLLKRWYIAVVPILLLLVGSISYYYLVVIPNRAVEEASKQTEIDNKLKLADNKASSGDINGSVEVYNSLIAEVDDSYTKSIYSSKKTSAYLNNNNKEEALKSAKEAFVFSENELTAMNLAFLYEISGMNQEAINTYEKAKTYLDKESPVYESSIKSINEIIEILKNESLDSDEVAL